MTATEFVTYLEGVKATPKGYIARCPAHDDARPSLSIREADDRLLVHCWAGCRTGDVLAALGLGYADLFNDGGKTKRTRRAPGKRQPEQLPHWYWDWPSQCGELERAIEAKREHHEAILAATHGLNINQLTPEQFDEVMTYVGRAYSWLDCCERLDDTLYLLQGTLRDEERQAERKNKIG